MASLTLAMQKFSTGVLVVLIFPGILGSMAFSGNVHAFHLWVAALINGLLYFILSYLLGHLAITLLRRRT